MKNNLFETDRLIAQKLNMNDTEFLFKYSQEEITKKELPDEVFESINKTKETIEYLIGNYNKKYPLVYGIILKIKDIIIGHISLSEINKGIEIGYAIAMDCQKKGYTSEIIMPFMNWIKNNLEINKIYGITKKENITSWKILEKNGFILENEGIFENYFGGKYITKEYSRII